MANVKLLVEPLEGFPTKKFKNTDVVQNPNSSIVYLQADTELDLTDDATPSQGTILSSGAIEAAFGGDVVVPIKVWGYVTTAVAASATPPVVTIEDSDGTDTGLSITLTDGDAIGDIAIAELTDGDAGAAVDVTAKDLVATVTTAAADAGTAAGKVKIVVACLLVK